MTTSPALENKAAWRPGCDWRVLQRRAAMLDEIRAFFRRAGVLEVETPQLWFTTALDPHLSSIATDTGGLYLQTSPEFAMKRLLAAGSGSIYQICKAFRRGEAGRWHNPEFTLLEWYRVGFDLPRLMEEVAGLLDELLGDAIGGRQYHAYAALFEAHIGVSWEAPLVRFERRAEALGLPEAAALCGEDRTLWLDFLFSHVIQPRLPRRTLVFVHDYPAPLAALARLKPEDPRVAERFEVFVDGIELANGYRELTDPVEQRSRFEVDLSHRRRAGLSLPPLDDDLLAALESGLPDCSGVAMGIDRVLMLALGLTALNEVLTFPLS
ncbi:MAG: EF-P lysine aminoacylase EpmA [Methylohalobius sp. ZOD2]